MGVTSGLLWTIFGLLGVTSQTTLHFAGIFPITGDWPLGDVIQGGAMMAVNDISEHPTILKNLPGGNYTIQIHGVDDTCVPGVGVRELVAQVVTPPAKIGIIGPGCSAVCVAVTDLAKYWNLQLISFANTPVLSDKTQYPNFWRFQPNDNYFADALVAFGSLFKWKTWFAIREDNSLFNLPVGHFQQSINELGWDLVASEVFPPTKFDEIGSHVTLLKNQGARIVYGAFYEGNARRVLCEAYKQGISWRDGVIWLLPGWFADGWQTPIASELADPTYRCTPAEAADAAAYVFQTSALGLAESGPFVYLEGETPSEWLKRWTDFRRSVNNQSTDLYWGPMAYDSMWAWAVALHQYINDGHSINDLLNYTNETATATLQSYLMNLNFLSASGQVKFDQNQDRPLPILIELTQGGNKRTVAIFNNGVVNMTDNPIVWPDGSRGVENAPLDKLINYFHLPFWVQIIVCVFTALVLVSLFLFLGVVIKYRDSAVIKATSVNFNVIILVGAIWTAATAFLFVVGVGSETEGLCCSRAYLPCLGIIITFSPLMIKTYRIFRIFHNPNFQSLNNLKDKILFQGVAIMVLVQLIFTFISLGISKPTPSLVHSPSLSSPGNTVLVTECSTSNEFIILTILYFAFLLIYSLYLTIRIRNVPDKYNESRHIAFVIIFYCVYGVIIVPLQVLGTDPSSVALLRGIGLLVGVAVTGGALFVPKMLALRKDAMDYLRSLQMSGGHTVRPSAPSADSHLTLSSPPEASNVELQ